MLFRSNWDSDEDRDQILEKQFPDSDLWVFDEIHKYRRWRNFIKGIYDKREPGQQRPHDNTPL